VHLHKCTISKTPSIFWTACLFRILKLFSFRLIISTIKYIPDLLKPQQTEAQTVLMELLAPLKDMLLKQEEGTEL
jgi:hypothetical protein